MDYDEEYVTHRNKERGSRGGRGRGHDREGKWGFTDDEVQELLCQGVKPWDEDARLSVFGLKRLKLFSNFRVRMFLTHCTRSDQKLILFILFLSALDILYFARNLPKFKFHLVIS